MSDKEKAASSLTLVVQSCDAALSGLAESVSAEDYPTSVFSVLRTDFLSLLAILYAATTKVALSLKPSEPHHKASLVPLRDLSNNVGFLVHSIRLMRLQQGSTIMAEYEKIARNVIFAIKGLAETLLLDDPKDYLIRTGEIHELIDLGRRAGGLSQNNVEAVKKLWLQEHDSLVDGYDEIQDICKRSDAGHQDNDENIFDDGWEELVISSDQQLSPHELDRAEKVQAMIKLVILLHKRIGKETLAADSFENNNIILDRISVLSNCLLTASDDLISSMYPHHDLPNIKSCFDPFWDVVKSLRAVVLPSQDRDLEEQLNSLSLSPSDKSTKWFAICFDQIDNAAAKILVSLQETNNSQS